MEANRYGEISHKKLDYKVLNCEGDLVKFEDFFRKRTEELINLDYQKKEEDRKNISYIEFLDKYTPSFSGIINSLSLQQKKIFYAIYSVYFEKEISNKLDFSDRKSDDFFYSLKSIIDNIRFKGINQSDLALYLGTTQNEISNHFKRLIDKGIIKESTTEGKKKLYILSDMDLVGFLVMRMS